MFAKIRVLETPPLSISNIIPAADHVVTKGSSLNGPSPGSSENTESPQTGQGWAEILPHRRILARCKYDTLSLDALDVRLDQCTHLTFLAKSRQPKHLSYRLAQGPGALAPTKVGGCLSYVAWRRLADTSTGLTVRSEGQGTADSWCCPIVIAMMSVRRARKLIPPQLIYV